MLVVRPRDRCSRPSQFVTEHDVMGALSAIAGTIAVVEMLEHADQPSVIKTCSVTGLSLHQPSECIGQPLVLEDLAAGDEVTAGRFVLAKTQEHFVTRVADDQIDG